MTRLTRPAIGCHAFDRWEFTPEGAAVHAGEEIAVIADVHLGYEWARIAAGEIIPAHSLAETLTRLSRLLDRFPISQLIVAGDLVESPRPCRRTAEDVAHLVEWLADRRVRLLVLEGNHDRSLNFHALKAKIAPSQIQQTLTIDAWTIAHGHLPLSEGRTITGHHHPVLRVSGVGAPCFLAGPNQIILPAFSCNAAGCDVRTAALPSEWLTSSLDCIVSTGAELLNFGPLARLRGPLSRLRS